MSVDERLNIAMLAKLCLFCYNPDYIGKHEDQDHKLKCVIYDKGKSGYSCQTQCFKQHLWIQLFRPSYLADKASVAKEPGTDDGAKEHEAKKTNVKQSKIAKTSSPKKLKLQMKMVTKSDGAETVQVKQVKSDFESPGTARIVGNSDQKSLFQNQTMEKLKKKMNANDRILFSRNTILEDQMFTIAEGMKDTIILGYGELGIIFKTNVFDHYHFSYVVGNYVHRIISKHRCHDICLRDSLYVCFSQGFTIIQGMTLFRELGQDCIGCIKIWKVIVQLKIAYEKEPRFTDRAARSSSLVKLFNTQVTTLVDHMNTFEKVVDALEKEDAVEGELVNEVKHDVDISQEKQQCGEVVQHRTVARLAKKINPCKTCCYIQVCITLPGL